MPYSKYYKLIEGAQISVTFRADTIFPVDNNRNWIYKGHFEWKSEYLPTFHIITDKPWFFTEYTPSTLPNQGVLKLPLIPEIYWIDFNLLLMVEVSLEEYTAGTQREKNEIL